MIGHAARRRVAILHHVEAVHLLLGLAAGRKRTDAFKTAFIKSNEIAIKRQDHIRLVELWNGAEISTECGLMSIRSLGTAERLISHPHRRRQLRCNRLLQSGISRRSEMFGKERNPLPVPCFFQHSGEPFRKFSLARFLASELEAARAVRIIDVQQRRLALRVRRTLVRGVTGISIHLGWTPVMRRRHERDCTTAMRTRSCVKNRLSGHTPFHALSKRHQRLFLTTAGTQRQSGQRRTRRHVFHEAATAHFGIQFGSAGLELTCLPFLEFRRLGKLPKAAPILRSIDLFLRMFENSFAHWSGSVSGGSQHNCCPADAPRADL